MLRRLARLSGTQGYALFVAIVVVVVLVYLFLSGALDSGSGDDTEQEIQQATPVEVQATAAPSSVAFEQSSRVGNLDIAIESITWTDEVRSQGRTQLATERFAILRLSAVNRGASPYQLQPDQIQIVSADGRSFVLDSLLSIGAAQYEPNPTLAPADHAAARPRGLAARRLRVTQRRRRSDPADSRPLRRLLAFRRRLGK